MSFRALHEKWWVISLKVKEWDQSGLVFATKALWVDIKSRSALQEDVEVEEQVATNEINGGEDEDTERTFHELGDSMAMKYKRFTRKSKFKRGSSQAM